MNKRGQSPRSTPAPARASSGLALRCMNLQAILNALRDGCVLSSTEIAAHLDVHPSTVTRLGAGLARAGLVLEEAVAAPCTGVGRPPKQWRLNAGAGYGVGLVVHPMTLRGVLVDLSGRPVARCTRHLDTPIRTNHLPRAASLLVRELTAGVPHDRVLGVGAGVTGIVAPDGGALVFSGGLQAPDGEHAVGYPLRDELEAMLGLPVHVANDANVAALAVFRRELRRGHVASDGSVLYLIAVEGLDGFGAGIVVGGDLYTGCRGMAGEVLHPRLAEWQPVGPQTAAAACSGDVEAQRQVIGELRPVLEYLAAVALMLDVDCIVLGGAFAALGSSIEHEFAHMLAEAWVFGDVVQPPTYRTLLDPLWPDTVTLGAADLVLDRLFTPPALGEPGPLVREVLAAESAGRAAV